MARRDVDLVIRAKDEAAKVVDQITKALNSFSDATRGVEASGEKTETVMSSLGAAINKLNGQLEGMTGGDKVSQQLDRASSAIARMEASMDDTAATAARQRRELSQTTEAATRYAVKLDRGTEKLRAQRQAVKESEADQKSLAKAYDQSVAAQNRAVGQQAQLVEKIQDQTVKLAQVRAEYEELGATLLGTTKPSATLVKQFEAKGRAVAEVEDRLSRYNSELASTQSTARAAGSALAFIQGAAEKTEASLAQQNRVLGYMEQNLETLGQQSSSTSAQQARLEKNLDRTNATLVKQSDTLSRAEQEYVDLASSAGKADAVMSQFANSSLAALSNELREQRRATLEAKREWGLAESNVRELAGAIRETTNPSEQLLRSFDATRARARAAKAEYQANAVALDQMGRAYQEAGNDMQSISAASQRIGAATRQLNGELGQIDDRANRAANAIKRQDDAARRHTGTVSRLAAAYREFYGDTRRSLSLLQRIRGEVLSLVAAYGGLYAGIEVIRAAVTATETLAGVSSRLNVAFGGDSGKAAQELDFIRRQADRLGVAFTDLATEYSKFAVATKDTNLEGEATRQIFVGIAEAARVNRASQSELQGVFTALTQIVSKGAVQMEELRQQLGDRLPGSIQLMADALGVTTAELIKMMEAGEVTADALLPFAEQVQQRFGPGLQDALDSTAASLGRLQNAAFQALQIFAGGGFIDGFQRFVQTLTEVLTSADFEAFAARAGAAMGQFFDFLAFGAENFQLLIAAATAFIALRLTPVILAILGVLKTFVGDLGRAGAAMRVFGAATTGTTTQMRAATVAAGRLRVAFATLLGSTGIGLLVAAVGAGIALWATEADTATEALNAHRKIVDAVKNAYDSAGASTEDWASKIEGATFSQALGNFEELRNQLRTARIDATNLVIPASGNAAARAEIQTLINLFRDGGIEAESYKRALESVADADPTVDRESIRALQDAADETANLEEATEKAQAVLVLYSEDASDAAKDAALVVLGVKDAFEESANSATEAAKKTQDFTDAMAKMGDAIPEVKEQLEFSEAVAELERLYAQASAAAQSVDELTAASKRFLAAKDALTTEEFASAAKDAISAASGNTGVEAAAGLLRYFEGFIPTPEFDVNAQRVGYGSDTITLADGTIKKVTKGMSVSVADANRDLMRRIETEFMPSARRTAGAARFDSFTPQQQAALTSIAYNYGSIPDRIAEEVRTGSAEEIATAIRSLAGDNNGINRKRRNQEAALFEDTASIEDAARRATQETLNRREAEQEAREATAERLADNEFEIEQQQRINAGKEREAAIQEAIREAKAENANITQQELDQIAQQTGRLFDLNEAKKNSTTASEQAKEAEEKVNNLLTQRNELEKQRQLALGDGDITKANELKAQIDEVNASLLSAIDAALALWSAVGGDAADAAIAKLGTAKIEADNFGQSGQRAKLDWSGVANLFVSGVSSALDTFAQKVAEGESATESAKAAFLQFASQFLIQIAQMIIQQAILNALQAAFGGTPFGLAIGLTGGTGTVGTAHTGGLIGGSRAGSGNSSRTVNMAAFIGATRYHTGGMVGFAPNEVPIIAKRGEEVLEENDPRHMLNGGLSGGGKATEKRQTIVNAFDAPSFLDSALANASGQEILFNFVRANRDEIKTMLG